MQLAVVGVDAFLRRPDIRRRGLRLAAVLLLVAGLGIGWSTSFRYSNLRSGSTSWSRTYPASVPPMMWHQARRGAIAG